LGYIASRRVAAEHRMGREREIETIRRGARAEHRIESDGVIIGVGEI